jgi:hypothetical protein
MSEKQKNTDSLNEIGCSAPQNWSSDTPVQDLAVKLKEKIKAYGGTKWYGDSWTIASRPLKI